MVRPVNRREAPADGGCATTKKTAELLQFCPTRRTRNLFWPDDVPNGNDAPDNLRR
jgi:hypothetical protein